jgi:hypothetical protein
VYEPRDKESAEAMAGMMKGGGMMHEGGGMMNGGMREMMKDTMGR